MGFKENLKGYLHFGRKDRLGLLGVLILALLIYLLPKIAATESAETVIKADTAVLAIIDTLEHRQNTYERVYSDDAVDAFQPSQRTDFTKGELFAFDPNTLSKDGWQRLGLSERTAGTIQKYVSKGGAFYKPEDLKKIWGLPKGFYERVSPYIQIEGKSSNTDFKSNYTPTTTYNRTDKRVSVVDVNTADTSAFIALPGIGSKLAFRIANFRDKLGGFYSVEQIKETYGLPDSTFQRLKPYLNVNGTKVRQFNINTATKDDLKVHPYIKWNLANAIVEYRNQHGVFKSLNDLKNIVLIDEATFSKIAPYLTL